MRDLQLIRRGIRQRPVVFPIEMGVVVGVCVEIAFGAVDRDLLHQARIAESAQRVIDCRQRNACTVILCRSKQAFGCDVAVLSIANKQFGKGKPLPCRTQSALCQPVCPTFFDAAVHW